MQLKPLLPRFPPHLFVIAPRAVVHLQVTNNSSVSSAILWVFSLFGWHNQIHFFSLSSSSVIPFAVFMGFASPVNCPWPCLPPLTAAWHPAPSGAISIQTMGVKAQLSLLLVQLTYPQLFFCVQHVLRRQENNLSHRQKKKSHVNRIWVRGGLNLSFWFAHFTDIMLRQVFRSGGLLSLKDYCLLFLGRIVHQQLCYLFRHLIKRYRRQVTIGVAGGGDNIRITNSIYGF